MDTSYLDRHRPNYFVLVIPVIIIALVGGGIFLWVKGRQSMVSPIPPTPSFEVIFMTPTPEPLSPTATPSATPKAAKATATAKPTAKASPTPEKSATPSATPKATSSPTAKPSPSNTPTP